jgi:hypothetical protein
VLCDLTPSTLYSSEKGALKKKVVELIEELDAVLFNVEVLKAEKDYLVKELHAVAPDHDEPTVFDAPRRPTLADGVKRRLTAIGKTMQGTSEKPQASSPNPVADSLHVEVGQKVVDEKA